jgi:hypothetical protein
VEKSDNISKIGLMITNKQNIFSGKVLNVIRTGDLQSIYPGQARIGNDAHNRIYQCLTSRTLFSFSENEDITVYIPNREIPNSNFQITIGNIKFQIQYFNFITGIVI